MTVTIALTIYLASVLVMIAATITHFRYNLKYGMKVRAIIVQGIIAKILIFTPYLNTLISVILAGMLLADRIYQAWDSGWLTREIKLGNTNKLS